MAVYCPCAPRDAADKDAMSAEIDQGRLARLGLLDAEGREAARSVLAEAPRRGM